MALAPNDEAISNSRTRPVTRESNVNRETVEADLKSDTAGVYALTAVVPIARLPVAHKLTGAPGKGWAWPAKIVKNHPVKIDSHPDT